MKIDRNQLKELSRTFHKAGDQLTLLSKIKSEDKLAQEYKKLEKLLNSIQIS
jgi:hypothetical protein